MSGEAIFVDTLTQRGRQTGQQYDSRSDHHSKVASWCFLFDVLHHAQHGPGGPYPLWRDVVLGRLGFRINHELAATVMAKKLDLVVCEAAPEAPPGMSFEEKGRELGVVVESAVDAAYLGSLANTPFKEVDPGHVGNARIVVEAKAAMSDLTGAMPRLYSEILAAGIIARDAQIARGWRKSMVMVSLNVVNTSLTYRSSTRGALKRNRLGEAGRVAKMLADAFRVGIVNKAFRGGPVFDAVGVTPIEVTNDPAHPVRLGPVRHIPSHARYGRMIQDVCNKYR